MSMAKIRKGDQVVVLTGKDRGRSGEVLRVMPRDGKALVQGINTITKHQKQTQTEEAGIVRREAPIQLSNLAVADPKDGKPTRIGFKINDDGTKVRVAKRSGSEL